MNDIDHIYYYSLNIPEISRKELLNMSIDNFIMKMLDFICDQLDMMIRCRFREMIIYTGLYTDEDMSDALFTLDITFTTISNYKISNYRFENSASSVYISPLLRIRNGDTSMIMNGQSSSRTDCMEQICRSFSYSNLAEVNDSIAEYSLNDFIKNLYNLYMYMISMSYDCLLTFKDKYRWTEADKNKIITVLASGEKSEYVKALCNTISMNFKNRKFEEISDHIETYEVKASAEENQNNVNYNLMALKPISVHMNDKQYDDVGGVDPYIIRTSINANEVDGPRVANLTLAHYNEILEIAQKKAIKTIEYKNFFDFYDSYNCMKPIVSKMIELWSRYGPYTMVLNVRYELSKDELDQLARTGNPYDGTAYVNFIWMQRIECGYDRADHPEEKNMAIYVADLGYMLDPGNPRLFNNIMDLPKIVEKLLVNSFITLIKDTLERSDLFFDQDRIVMQIQYCDESLRQAIIKENVDELVSINRDNVVSLYNDLYSKIDAQRKEGSNNDEKKNLQSIGNLKSDSKRYIV